jgi:succinate dehydrogenase / fumarate reductase cytochrome b subunit
MPSPATTKKARPLSPHLQVYRLPLSANLSITHRLTGVGLSCGLPVFVLWLLALSGGEKSYECFLRCAHSIVGQILLMGWSWAFAFHLCTGVRHLFWDMGYGLENPQVYKSGYLALAVSVVLTLGLWCKLLWVSP